MAGGGGGGSGPQPGPSSEGTGAVTHGKLVSGAGGTYLPILPADITPTGSDPRNPLGIAASGAEPAGHDVPGVASLSCRPGIAVAGRRRDRRALHPPRLCQERWWRLRRLRRPVPVFRRQRNSSRRERRPHCARESRDRSECRRPRDRGHGIPAHTGYLGGRTTGRTIRWELPGSDLLVQPALPRGRCSTAGAADHRPQQSTVSDRGQSRRGSDKVVGSRRHRCAPGRRRDVADVCAHPHLRLDRVRQCRWPRSHTTR